MRTSKQQIDNHFSQLLKKRKILSKLWAICDELEEEATDQSRQKLQEIKPKIKEIEQQCGQLEDQMYNPDNGVYVGIATDLDAEGKVVFKPLYLKWANLDNHFIIYGTTRYGKSRLLGNLARQIIEKGDHIIIVDPKGGPGREILCWMIEALMEAKRHSDLFIIDPAFLNITDFFNPMFGLSNEQRMSLVIFLLSGGSISGDADFFATVGERIMACNISLQYLERIADPTGQYTKKKIQAEVARYQQYVVHRMESVHGMHDKETDFADRLNSDCVLPRSMQMDSLYNHTLATFADMLHYTEYDNLYGLLSAVKIMEPDPATKYVDSSYKKMLELRQEAIISLEGVLKVKEDQFFKITMGLSALLAKLSTGAIGKLFCSTRINPLITRLYRSDKKLACYINPGPLRYARTSEMIMKVFLKTIEGLGGSISASGRLFDNRGFMLIDEAQPIMFPGIEQQLNKIGGLGWTLGIFTQSQADMRSKLGKDLAEVSADSINTVGAMRTNDPNSKKIMSQIIGEKRKITLSQMMSVDAARFQVTKEFEAIVHPDSFSTLNKGEAMLTHMGKSYFVMFPYQADPSIFLEMPLLEEEILHREAARLEEELSMNFFEQDIASLDSP